MTPSRYSISLIVLLIAATVIAGGAAPAAAQQAPAGQLTQAWHVTIAPSWFDPSTAPPQITPFGMLYAIHDAPLASVP